MVPNEHFTPLFGLCVALLALSLAFLVQIVFSLGSVQSNSFFLKTFYLSEPVVDLKFVDEETLLCCSGGGGLQYGFSDGTRYLKVIEPPSGSKKETKSTSPILTEWIAENCLNETVSKFINLNFLGHFNHQTPSHFPSPHSIIPLLTQVGLFWAFLPIFGTFLMSQIAIFGTLWGPKRAREEESVSQIAAISTSLAVEGTVTAPSFLWAPSTFGDYIVGNIKGYVVVGKRVNNKNGGVSVRIVASHYATKIPSANKKQNTAIKSFFDGVNIVILFENGDMYGYEFNCCDDSLTLTMRVDGRKYCTMVVQGGDVLAFNSTNVDLYRLPANFRGGGFSSARAELSDDVPYICSIGQKCYKSTQTNLHLQRDATLQLDPQFVVKEAYISGVNVVDRKVDGTQSNQLSTINGMYTVHMVCFNIDTRSIVLRTSCIDISSDDTNGTMHCPQFGFGDVSLKSTLLAEVSLNGLNSASAAHHMDAGLLQIFTVMDSKHITSVSLPVAMTTEDALRQTRAHPGNDFSESVTLESNQLLNRTHPPSDQQPSSTTTNQHTPVFPSSVPTVFVKRRRPDNMLPPTAVILSLQKDVKERLMSQICPFGPQNVPQNVPKMPQKEREVSISIATNVNKSLNVLQHIKGIKNAQNRIIMGGADYSIAFQSISGSTGAQPMLLNGLVLVLSVLFAVVTLQKFESVFC